MIWRRRRRDVRADELRQWDKRDRRSFVLCLASLPVIALLIWWRIGVAQRQRGPWIDETGIVTVVGLVDGRSGRFRAHYDHHVTLENGPPAVMRFARLLPKGSRVWVSYRRWPATNHVYVKAYVPQ